MSSPANWGLQREALALKSLRQSGRLRLMVHGESMLPSLWPCEIVQIESASLDGVARGDIVLAYRDGRFYLHRLLSTSGSGFISRGDSMPVPDPAYSADHLVGKLTAVERRGKVVKTTHFGFWSRLLGWLFCKCGPTRRFALRLRRRRIFADPDWALSGI